MRKTLLVMRQEIHKTLHNAGFVLFGCLLPLALVLVLVGIRHFQESNGAYEEESPSPSSQFTLQIEGYVDQSNLIHFIPQDVVPGQLVRYDDESQAQQALEAGEITAYYLIPPNILAQGKVYYVYPDTRSYLDDGQSWVMAWTILANLLEGDIELADRVWNPIKPGQETNLEPQALQDEPPGEDCSRPGGACASNSWARYMPSIMSVLLFFVLLTSSSRLLDSIGIEKENQVIEVLLLSIHPSQLLAGKVLGFGVTGLFQTVIWSASIYVAFNLHDSILQLPEHFVFPLEILLISLVCFSGGYGVYASLMAGVGALAPRMKEAGAVSYLVIFPLLVGYAFSVIAPLAESVDSGFLVFLSIFPLTSPVVMIMRLTNGAVPSWQIVLSLGLLYVTAFLTLHTAAAIFQAQNLLSGVPFSLRRFFAVLIGQ